MSDYNQLFYLDIITYSFPNSKAGLANFYQKKWSHVLKGVIRIAGQTLCPIHKMQQEDCNAGEFDKLICLTAITSEYI